MGIGTSFGRHVGRVVRPIRGSVREEVSEAKRRRVKISGGRPGEGACRTVGGLGINFVTVGIAVGVIKGGAPKGEKAGLVGIDFPSNLVEFSLPGTHQKE